MLGSSNLTYILCYFFFLPVKFIKVNELYLMLVQLFCPAFFDLHTWSLKIFKYYTPIEVHRNRAIN